MHPSNNFGARLLLVLIAGLVALVVALVAGVLSRADGASLYSAALRGGAAFGATFTLVIVAFVSAGLLPA